VVAITPNGIASRQGENYFKNSCQNIWKVSFLIPYLLYQLLQKLAATG
jgi:hypothetical protein